MRHIYTIIFTVLLSSSTFAQAICEGRYLEPVFENIKVDSITYSDVTTEVHFI